MHNRTMVVTVLLVVTVCIGAIAEGAQEQESAEGGEAAISLMGPIIPQYRYEEYQKIKAMYEEANPNVTIELEQIPGWNQTEQTVLVRYAAGNAPDIVQSGETGAVTSFAAGGMFAELDSYLQMDTTLKPEDFFPGPFEMGQYEGVTYAIPQDSMTSVLYYNVDLLDQAGIQAPPESLDELMEMARDISDLGPDMYGFAFPNDDTIMLAQILYPMGGSFMDEDNETILFNDPTGVAALKYLVDATLNYEVAPPRDSDIGQLWANGKVGMIIGQPWWIGWTSSNAPDLNMQAALIPAGEAGPMCYGWGHYLSIVSSSELKDEAWDYISWLLSDEIDLMYHDRLNFLPAKIDTWQKAPFNENQAWRVFAKQLEYTRGVPAIPEYREMNSLLQTEMESALFGQKSAQQALNDAARAASAELGFDYYE